MEMERLPAEITTDILSRLPFKSTGQCKCVSKQWNSILSHPEFHKLQLTQLSKLTPDILLLYNVSKSPKSGLLYIEDNEQEHMKPLKKYDHQFIPESHFRCAGVLGSCNGFICVSDQSMFDISALPRNPIYVANPITGERSSLPHYKVPKLPFTSGGDFGKGPPDLYLSGFVYNEFKDEFKLVLVLFTPRNFNKPGDFKNEVQVCDLGRGVWNRKADVVPDMLRRASDGVSSAYVSGCLHWVIINGISSSEGFALVSFNVELEEFDFVPTPLFDYVRAPGSPLCMILYFKLGVLEDKLCVVKCFSDSCIQISVMEKYGVKESWVIKFSIQQDLIPELDRLRCYVDLIKFRKNGELLLLCGNDNLVSYNSKSQKCKSLTVEGVTGKEGCFLVAHPFVGRLISMKSAFGMESEAFGMENSILSGEMSFLAPFLSR